MNIEYKNVIPDKQAYFELFETTGWNKMYQASADELRQVLEQSSYLISAFDGKKLAGFGRVLLDGALHAIIYDLIVIPAYKRQGIGFEILSRLLDFSRARNMTDIQLFAAKGTIPFYEKLGFKPRPADAPGMQYKRA